MDALLEKALTVAPFMVIALVGVGYIARLFLTHIEQAEQQRRDWATERHKEFFQVVQSATEGSQEVIRENTKALGAVAERLREGK